MIRHLTNQSRQYILLHPHLISIASHSMRFSSRSASKSSHIDEELDAMLRVSKVWWSSSDNCTQTHPCWIKSLSIVHVNEVVSISLDKYNVPSAPRCRTMAYTSCPGIHPNDNISMRDTMFKSTGSGRDAMTQIHVTRWRITMRKN